MECMRLSAGGMHFVRCREVVRSSECPLLEVPLYSLSIIVPQLCLFPGTFRVPTVQNCALD